MDVASHSLGDQDHPDAVDEGNEQRPHRLNNDGPWQKSCNITFPHVLKREITTSPLLTAAESLLFVERHLEFALGSPAYLV